MKHGYENEVSLCDNTVINYNFIFIIFETWPFGI